MKARVADVDGDGKADATVWRPQANGSAYFVGGLGIFGPAMIWGKTGDIVLAGW